MVRYSAASKQSVYRSNYALSNDVMAHYAPSVVATEAHESRGDKYAFIPTIEVIDGLRKEGFQPYEIRQTQTRDVGRRSHTKHMVRLRHESAITTKAEVAEIILLNSHDGSSSYQLMSGVFRFVCSNGLIAGDVFNDIRIRHSGRIVDDVIEGATRVLHDTYMIMERIDAYKAISLSPAEQTAFGAAALQLRWGDSAPVSTRGVLQANRWADEASDLWTTFNRAQENLVKGGVSGKASTGRRLTTRAVGGVTENVKLNKALWTLADRLATIKQDKNLDQWAAQYEHAYPEQ